ncbi:hypothetical protein BT63DRAFT_484315 [Microthyrium microscopicum]|uniref:Uncharacterized protein n=1 Tax=Microthyrium microscopicum TaxID=703497 RepID=A0A6A6TXN0_9PEZI|nr:hypothetical protein BT63DRAFT_484315 [Microthyrium microscopicum]
MSPKSTTLYSLTAPSESLHCLVLQRSIRKKSVCFERVHQCTMHRALLIPELQASIIDFVGDVERTVDELHKDEVEPCKGRHDLLSVALTCKTFLPYALDCRWRVIYSLLELVRVLSPEIWTSHEQEPEDFSVTTLFTLSETIAEEHIVRFKFYAARVRTLIQHDRWLRRTGPDIRGVAQKYYQYDHSVFSQLKSLLKDEYILPRLDNFHIHMDLDDYQFENYLSSLFPPSLKSFCIETPLNHTNTPQVVRFLQIIKPACQKLAHLRVASIYDDDTDEPGEESVDLVGLLPVQELSQIPHLKSFGTYWGLSEIQYMAAGGLLHIAPFCNVTKLNLSLYNSLIGTPEHHTGPFFPALEDLNLQAASLQECGVFIRCLSSGSLKSLHIDIQYNPSEDFSGFVTDVEDHLNSETLLHFDIQCRDDSLRNEAVPIFPCQILTPLFTFKNLETLIIILNQDFTSLDDDTFHQLCHAFPRLRILDIAGYEYYVSTSLHGMMTALQQLSFLEVFGINMRMSVDLPSEPEYKFPSIKALAPRGSPVADVGLTVGFIQSVFPSLKFIVIGGEPTKIIRPLDERIAENDSTEGNMDPTTEARPRRRAPRQGMNKWIDVVSYLQHRGLKIAGKEPDDHPARFGDCVASLWEY